ncbi:hypothetical protein [Ornithinimicrobium kibberense]|uniref:hypothetical protein n=1 Tax=Ornithinimicrobium kibberense TaxID=282060 RepID=UPI003613E423
MPHRWAAPIPAKSRSVSTSSVVSVRRGPRMRALRAPCGPRRRVAPPRPGRRPLPAARPGRSSSRREPRVDIDIRRSPPAPRPGGCATRGRRRRCRAG